MPKPKVFIGSSTEQLKTAYVLKNCLGSSVHPVVWDEAEFKINDSIFGGLLQAADQFDFAVFIFDSDDKLRIRHTEVRSVRDNVLFELGLFTGRMGRERSFWLRAERPEHTHIPTDLAGIVSLAFKPPKSTDPNRLRAALERCCQRLREEMERLGTRGDRSVEELDSIKGLCVGSSQYTKAKFAKEIRHIHDNFPPRSIKSAYGVTAQKLFDLFSHGPWDIVHLSMYADKKGDLLVPEANSPRDQQLRATAVARFMEMCQARLVVIVTCDSLALGAELARVTNTIAGYRPIDIQSALDWSATFYHFLAQGCPLSEAFSRARDITDPGLVLGLKRDFRVSIPKHAAAKSPRVRG